MTLSLAMASSTPNGDANGQTWASFFGSFRGATRKVSGRTRVSIVLAVSTLFLLCVALNLKSIYGGHGYYYDYTPHTVSLVFECILSVVLLGMLAFATNPTHFVSSLAVALTTMVMFIIIFFLADSGAANNGRVLSTWSVLSFWIGFVFEALLRIGYHVTGWLAVMIEGEELGRIRLAGEQSTLPHAQYRDIPTPRQLQVDQIDARVASVDLERGEQPPHKDSSVDGN